VTSVKTRIESIGTYLPDKVVSNEELVRDNPALDGRVISRAIGIDYRRVCDRDSENSHELALKAARRCLEDSQYTASELDIILVTSISRSRSSLDRHYFEPSQAAALARDLGATKAIHFDVVNACAGMSTGILVLNNMIAAGRVKTGMVVSGEATSDISANAVREMTGAIDSQFASLTVGDAGAAVVLDKAIDESNVINFVGLFTKAEHARLCVAKPSDKSASVAMYTDPALASLNHLDYCFRLLEKTLEDRGTNIVEEGIDYWIFHQVALPLIEGGTKMVEDSLYRNGHRVETINTVRKYGNTSSAALFVTLDDGLKGGLFKETKNVLLIPMASGFVAGMINLTITK
jgi:3-oxoacyl-[acyl-carrier-protein] synthase-3